MKNKFLIVMKKTFIDSFSVLKTSIYISIILIFSYFLIFKDAESYMQQTSSLLEIQSKLVSNYFTMGFFIVVGIPFILYLILLSAGIISREIDKGTFLLIFSRPVKKFDILFGKFLGIFFYFFLINSFILFLLPSLESLFLGLSKSTLFLLYKTSFVLLIYSSFIIFFIVCLALVFSTKFRKTITTAIILIMIIIGIFLMPIANMKSQEKIYVNDFASFGIDILNGFNLPHVEDSMNLLVQTTGAYKEEDEIPEIYNSQEIISRYSRNKIMPFWLNLSLIISLSVASFLLSLFLLKRKEIY